MKERHQPPTVGQKHDDKHGGRDAIKIPTTRNLRLYYTVA